MIKQVLIGLLALIVMACNKTDDMELELTEIHQGALYGAGEEDISEENFVIEKEQDWQDLLAKINAVNNESDNFSETEIDFDEFIVVACFDKARGSGGYSIKIADINSTKKEINLTVIKNSPADIAPAVITQPYYIAKLPKTNKKITFTE
ncbi:MAG: protease complex subunit PrcB family protein [Crocinitomix sp.]|nr:protease complex subunit PrcB family protein [Crocinitomix sp.]